MAHDRNFQRKQKDARMPVRDSHGEDRMAARQGEPDYDLRRARDAPSSGTSRNRRQAAPVQTETYGSDIFAGCENSDTAAQDSPIQVFPGQEPTGSEPYAPETGPKDSGRGGQGQSNAAYRDSRQKDSGQESPGRRNAAYRDSRQEGPRQEGPERRNSAYQNFRQEESHRRIPDRKISDGQLLQNTVRKVRISGMGKYFRKTPGHRRGKKNPARQDAGTGHGSMAINTSSASGRRHRPGNRRRRQKEPPGTGRKKLPSWNLPLTNSLRKRRIKNSRKPGGRQNGPQKSWNRRRTAFLPAAGCGWKRLLTLIRARPKSA